MKILMTGVTKGVGRLLLEQLLGDGHEVWGIARTEPSLKSIQEKHSNFRYSVLDLIVDNAIDELIHSIRKEEFQIDVVFFMAAISRINETGMDWPEFNHYSYKLNYSSIVELTSSLLSDKNPPKQFILISSLFAQMLDVSNPIYSSTKAGISNYFESLQYSGEHSSQFKIVYMGPIEKSGDKRRFGIPSIKSCAIYLKKVLSSSKSRYSYPWFAPLFVFAMMMLPKSLYNYIFFKLRR